MFLMLCLSCFIQFVADNVDHNLRTLDDLGTFHGMGIIGAATPIKKLSDLIRRDISLTVRQTSTLGQIPVHQRLTFSLKYEELQDLRFEDITRKVNLLKSIMEKVMASTNISYWLYGLILTVSEGSYPGQSMITFLTMIDMQPTNTNCIIHVYSILHFVSKLAAKIQSQPVFTFDLPL
ncbi:hypothetical protein RRG08_002248 [Elysia crispata]|uniref:Uncharacterized protein n=1 Tax=Elysia crispata TaxID=231223 RepID=A0AAE1DDK0_9GAST|nr:hypothetical protein RRG08_002248 [Elysia crispata]